VLVGQGTFTLGPDVLGEMQKRDGEKQSKEKAKAKKEWQELLRKVTGVETTLASVKGSNVRLWNAKECKCFLQLKKNNANPAMPSKIEDLRERCRIIMAEN